MKTILAAVGLAALFASCGGEPAGWTAVDPGTFTDGDRAVVDRAKGAAADLASRLMMELGAALASSGPAGAVAVCRDRAPAIAAAVGTERGLRIGRTSHLLRNPGNRPPEWAAALVASIPADTAAARAPRLFRGPGGTAGVTLPIETKAFCAACHGMEAEIPDAVRAQLSESYPEDRARGFREGDLRGLFWVEIPGD